MLLPSACMQAFTWAAPIETYKEILTEKAHKRHLHTGTNRFFSLPSKISNKCWNKSFVSELTAQAIDSALNHMLSQGTVPFKMAARFCASLWCDELKTEIQLIQVWKWNMSSQFKSDTSFRGFSRQWEQIPERVSWQSHWTEQRSYNNRPIICSRSKPN